MRFFRNLVVFFVISVACYAKAEEFQIYHISTEDYRSVCIDFKGRSDICAYSKELDLWFHSYNGRLILPVDNSSSSFIFYDYPEQDPVGNMVFKYVQAKEKNNKKPYVYLKECTFTLPTREDVIHRVSKFKLSGSDYMKLVRKIYDWNPTAVSTICSSKSDLIQRCSLIIEFLWSSEPLVNFPPSYVNKLSLIDRLEGFQRKDFPLLCGGVAQLFVEIACALMPDLQIRLSNGFECYYPEVYTNIHVNSHVFVEIKKSSRWIYIDPYFQFYLTNRSGSLLGIKEIKMLINKGDFTEFVPVKFPANPPLRFTIDGVYDLEDFIRRTKLFECFSYIRINELI